MVGQWLQKTKKNKRNFFREATIIIYECYELLKDVFKICTSFLEKEMKKEISYFIAVRSFIMKTNKTGTPDLKEVNHRISKMLEEAILGDEVLVLSEAGSSDNFDLLTEENLQKLQAMPQKNIAANILMRVMKEKVDSLKKVNLVKSKEFSEKLQRILEQYNNRHDEEDVYVVLEELIKLKDAILISIEEGTQLDLTYEEKAFFDVLTEDLEILETMDREVLLMIAKDLAKVINDTIKETGDEWYKSERAQAKMRTKIKRLLRKYDYPPNKSEQAINHVLEQAELQCMSMR